MGPVGGRDLGARPDRARRVSADRRREGPAREVRERRVVTRRDTLEPGMRDASRGRSPEASRARSGGGEFRGYGATRRNPIEDMIWRFRPDGSVTSISTIRRRAGPGSLSEEYRDAGNWRVEGDRLCVDFAAAHRDLSGCYVVDGVGGDHVRLIGPVQLQGTLSR